MKDNNFNISENGWIMQSITEGMLVIHMKAYMVVDNALHLNGIEFPMRANYYASLHSFRSVSNFRMSFFLHTLVIATVTKL